MSLQEISKDILSKAESEKQLIEDAANNEIKSLELEFENNFEQFKSKLIKKHETESNFVSSKISSKYSKLCKDIELDAKSQVLSTVKTQTLDKILNLSKSDREKILKKLFSVAKSLIKYDIVYTSKSDLAYVKTLVTSKVEVKSKDDLIGLIFETKDGLEKLDLNFESLFNDILSENEAQVQNILFK